MDVHLKGFVDLGSIKGFIDLDVTTNEDNPGPPAKLPAPKKSKYVAGENLRAGEMLYLDTDDRAFKATALITCGDDSTKSAVIGAAKTNVSAGSEVDIATTGENTKCIIDGTLVVGKCVYLSTVPGRVTSTMPTASGTARLKVGIARNANEIKLDIESPIFNT